MGARHATFRRTKRRNQAPDLHSLDVFRRFVTRCRDGLRVLGVVAVQPLRRTRVPTVMIAVLVTSAKVAGTAGLLWYTVMPP